VQWGEERISDEADGFILRQFVLGFAFRPTSKPFR
jgi:hypothetical protein